MRSYDGPAPAGPVEAEVVDAARPTGQRAVARLDPPDLPLGVIDASAGRPRTRGPPPAAGLDPVREHGTNGVEPAAPDERRRRVVAAADVDRVGVPARHRRTSKTCSNICSTPESK